MVAPREIHHKPPHRPHVAELVNEPISILAPYSALILTITMVIYFMVRFYVFEGFLMVKCYGEKYTKLSDINRRGFVNHHIAGLAKIIMFVTGCYPFIAVAFGRETLHTRFSPGSTVTLGDVLIVLNQVFIGMYIFELLYRAKLSPVAVMHHVGAITIAQSAVAMSLNWEHERDATIEFILCFVWGVFDIIAEFWPHVAIILYRLRTDDHVFLIKVFRSACYCTFAGTIIETIVVMWLFGSLWDRWTISFKVATPLLHCVFSAAQIWGSWNFYCMWQGQKKKLAAKTTGSDDLESVGVVTSVTVDANEKKA